MIILGIDSSAAAGSAAVICGGKLLSECYVNVGLTHSQTLMPLIASAVENAGLGAGDIDLVAVTTGPGSFTGVRIGVACAKGLAAPHGIPCLGVSTLEAVAYPLTSSGCVAVPVMDARREQVYCALFRCAGGKAERLAEDAALSLAELKSTLDSYDEKIILIGDGAEISYKYLKSETKNLYIASPQIRFQRASSAAFIAEREILYNSKSPVSAASLAPSYLRMPQAERELKKKKENTK